MNHYKTTILITLTVLSLSACGSREGSDAKLAKGCEFGVKSILAQDKYDRQITSVTKTSFADGDKAKGERVATLSATVKNKSNGLETTEDFTCRFEENYSLFFMAYRASLINLNIGTEKFGLENGQILGSVQDQMRLMDAVETGMQ